MIGCWFLGLGRGSGTCSMFPAFITTPPALQDKAKLEEVCMKAGNMLQVPDPFLLYIW